MFREQTPCRRVLLLASEVLFALGGRKKKKTARHCEWSVATWSDRASRWTSTAGNAPMPIKGNCSASSVGETRWRYFICYRLQFSGHRNTSSLLKIGIPEALGKLLFLKFILSKQWPYVALLRYLPGRREWIRSRFVEPCLLPDLSSYNGIVLSGR